MPPIDPLTGQEKPAGIISTAIDREDPLGSVSGVTAAQRQINPATDTVQGQVKSIIDDDSPLQQQAVTASKQDANSHGLLNSSMAVQAGREATYKAALPIAAADASAYNNVGAANQAATNRASEVTAQAQNAGAMLLEQGSQQRKTQAEGAAQGIQLQTLRGDQAQGLADTEAQYKTLLQSSAGAASTFNVIAKNIQDITADVMTSSEFKATAVAAQIQLLKSSLAVIGGIANLNLNELLEFPA